MILSVSWIFGSWGFYLLKLAISANFPGKSMLLSTKEAQKLVGLRDLRGKTDRKFPSRMLFGCSFSSPSYLLVVNAQGSSINMQTSTSMPLLLL